jgi:hypothetical protein
MLINARDPRQWTYLRNLPPPQKKKTLVLTNVGKRAVGGYYIPVGSMYLKKSEPSVSGMKEHTCLHSKPAGKGRKKKTLDINPGQHHLKYTEAGSAIENAEADSAIE